MNLRRYEGLFLFALQPYYLYYFCHLIIRAHDVELRVRVLKHLLARAEWEARHTLEQHLEVLPFMVVLVITRTFDQLSQHAANTPCIYFEIIDVFTQYNFRRPVPPCCDLHSQFPFVRIVITPTLLDSYLLLIIDFPKLLNFYFSLFLIIIIVSFRLWILLKIRRRLLILLLYFTRLIEFEISLGGRRYLRNTLRHSCLSRLSLLGLQDLMMRLLIYLVIVVILHLNKQVGQGTCQSKVTYFDITFVGNKYIRWLEIPMNNVSRMQKVNCTQHIVHQCLHMLLSELTWVHVGEHCAKVLVEVLHHYEDVGELLVLGLTGDNNVKQLRSEQISFHPGQLSHDGDLSEDLATLVNVSEYISYQFDGNHLAGLLVAGLYYLPETALPNQC